MDYREMAERYYDKKEDKINISKKDFVDAMEIYMKEYDHKVILKNDDEIKVDKIVSKQIIIHLEEFFKRSKKNHTIKKRYKVKNRATKRHRKK